MTLLPYNTQMSFGLTTKFDCADVEEPPASESESSEESLPSDSEDDDRTDSQPEDLDEPWSYTFKVRDIVWVKTTGGDWYQGKVSSSRTKTSQTRQGMGTYYPVKFHINKNHIAKDFAPLNGEIKPDTSHIRSLLEAGGWL